MNHTNLLPPDRQAALRHRRARRRWLTINSVYAVVLAMVGVGYAVSRPALPFAPPGRPPDVAALNATLVSLRKQAAALQAGATSDADTSERPDFGRLLTAVARTRGDDVALEVFDLGAVNGSTANHSTTINATANGAAATAPTATRTLVLAGVGRSHAAVTQFALRVEAMGLFTAVRLIDVTARPIGAGEGVGFRLQCGLPAEGE